MANITAEPKIAMMIKTTNSSTSVKPRETLREDRIGLVGESLGMFVKLAGDQAPG
jgi:hypothetical protein